MTRVMKFGADRAFVASAFIATLVSFSQAAVAEDKTIFWIDHDVLRYNSNTDKPKTGPTQKQTGWTTTPRDVTVGIFWSDYGVYVTPGEAGGLVQGSYYVKKDWEIGLNLGFNNSTTKDQIGTGAEVKYSSNTYGLFTTYYLTLSDVSSWEFTLNYNHTDSEASSTPNNGTETKSVDGNRDDVTILAQYVYQVAPHFNVIPGIAYTFSSGRDKLSKSDIDQTGLTVNVLHFRYIF